MVEVNVEPGDHTQFIAPIADKVVLEPAQIVDVEDVALTNGNELTFIVLVVEFTHPVLALVPIMVQVVVLNGIAITEVPVELFKLAAGDHVYDSPRLANILAL